jgi:predicted 3-demethylubiquinone-9 3-methyltransferase (glyoxalase superfamily)
MTTVKQHLWFASDMVRAVTTYTSLIPDSAIEWMSPIGADTPSGPAGSVKLAAFTLGGQRYMAIEAGPLDPFNRSFAIMVECDDQAEIDHLWAALGDGGKYSQCGWLTDRWGLSWQIIPKRLGVLMSDPAKAPHVTKAMLQMKKFDIAALDEAALLPQLS